jgi:tetratricopeptide (TPR) repeat protein
VAGNRRQYERALKRADGHAEKQEWNNAVTQYQLALAEFPDDVAALTGAGLAYLKTQQLEKALAAYQRARQAGADDAKLLERLADVQERLRRLEEAADTYVGLAEHALREREIERAIHAWKRAIQLVPGHPIARLNLAKAYASQGNTRAAIREYLALAEAFRQEKRPDQAMNICQQALMLDPSNAKVLNLMSTLRDLVEPVEAIGPARQAVSVADLDDLSFEDELPSSAERDEGSPVDMAQQRALSALAEAVFEEDLAPVTARPASAPVLTKHQIDTLIGQALDFQRLGQVDDAVAAYEQLLNAGVDRPEVHFNLGLLYQEKQQWDGAIRHLSAVQDHADYEMGALFAIGECYRTQGKIDLALPYLMEVLKLVDLATVRRDQADDLIQLYEGLADSHARKGDPGQVRSLTDSLIRFLSSKGWEDKARQARKRLDSVAGDGVLMSLAEMVGVPGAEAILESMAMIRELVGQGKGFAAIEEAYDAIRVSPFYLPLHLRLGEVFLSQGLFGEATSKFLTVAHLYQVRGDVGAAVGVFRRLLQSSPMDVAVRTRLIDLLVSQGAIDGALKEYMALGETYFQLAQVDKALEKYNEALHLAPRGSDEKAWAVKLLRSIADIYLQRADWRQALQIYQHIKQVSPYDERACLGLVDLYYKMGRSREGLAELDKLVGYLFKGQEFEKALAILQDAVQMRPEEEALRMRLARAYLAQGKREKAVAELDALGDLQLGAGRTQQAIQTIEAIIDINPPNVESYRQLLEQLGRR